MSQKTVTNVTIPNELNAAECRKHTHTVYTYSGGKVATAANWKREGLAPKDNAQAITMHTKAGHEFTVFHESQVEKYDAEAEARKVEAIRDLKKQKTDIFNSFMKHEVNKKDFEARDAEVNEQLIALMS